jgi:hypothetical protein
MRAYFVEHTLYSFIGASDDDLSGCVDIPNEDMMFFTSYRSDQLSDLRFVESSGDSYIMQLPQSFTFAACKPLMAWISARGSP